MTVVRNETKAFGGPGIAPRWTRGAKDAVGTAYSSSSRVWFTASAGILNEIYYPTIDRPQVRDLQFLVTDGRTFLHDERRDLATTMEYIDHHALGVRVVNRDPQDRYLIDKEIIADPHQPAVLTRVRFEVRDPSLRLRLFVLVAPHLDVGGWHNTATITEVAERKLLTATGDQQKTWLACAATVPFRKCSSGYVGESDGWTDLQDFEMDWEFDTAPDGNVALTGEFDLSETSEFTLGIAFGDGLHNAASTLVQALGFPFAHRRRRFVAQWRRAVPHVESLAKHSGDGGELFHMSHRILLAHEDKTYPGAMIASMSIPWGETKSDEDLGGYHLVWPRDMVHSATGLLASGHTETPLRALMYLATAQQADGGFAQNFWINGDPYWTGIQLDEVAFPILLADQLRGADSLQDFDPYSMVMRGAGYLVREGPATEQERWEENAGYSPSTLASNIAALTCAAEFAASRGDRVTSRFLQEYADFVDAHVERWTVTTDGSLVPGIPRHYIRLHPVEPGDVAPNEDPNAGEITLRNRAPGEQAVFPAKDVVDGGFLELVRYGVRDARDPIITDTVRVIDEVLRVETPFGPCWRRYNHDGYGQRSDGTAFEGWGRGRAWPLLTGERGHHELAAGRSTAPYLRAMERFASDTRLLPEQVWDEPDLSQARMYHGRPTGAAMPLAWAHAEYIKLLRSTADGRIFDLVPGVAERYARGRRPSTLEIWKFNRQPKSVPGGSTLRIVARARFRLRHWPNGSEAPRDVESVATSIGIHFADLAPAGEGRAPFRFTFYWPESGNWEDREFQVDIVSAPVAALT